MENDKTTSQTNESNSKSSKTRRIILLSVLGILIIIGAIYGWNWYKFSKSHARTDNAQIEGNISPVIPRVEGYVTKILIKDNETVKAGQTLFRIDPSDLKLMVDKAKAGLADAEAGLEEAKAQMVAAEATVSQLKVTIRQTSNEKERQEQLKKDKATTQQAYDQAGFAYQNAEAQEKVASRQVSVARVKINQAQTRITQRMTELQDARLKLSYTDVKAPMDGIVSQRNVEPGQFVRPGVMIMAISTEKDVWVVANFKEGKIAGIHPGQTVDVEVDAYPDHSFKAQVESIGAATGSKFALLPPDNASGNFVKVEQRIPVKIIFNDPLDPQWPLRPGMNVIPTITLDQQQ